MARFLERLRASGSEHKFKLTNHTNTRMWFKSHLKTSMVLIFFSLDFLAACLFFPFLLTSRSRAMASSVKEKRTQSSLNRSISMSMTSARGMGQF